MFLQRLPFGGRFTVQAVCIILLDYRYSPGLFSFVLSEPIRSVHRIFRVSYDTVLTDRVLQDLWVGIELGLWWDFRDVLDFVDLFPLWIPYLFHALFPGLQNTKPRSPSVRSNEVFGCSEIISNPLLPLLGLKEECWFGNIA